MQSNEITQHIGRRVRNVTDERDKWLYTGTVGKLLGWDPEFPDTDVRVELPDGTIVYTTPDKIRLEDS